MVNDNRIKDSVHARDGAVSLNGIHVNGAANGSLKSNTLLAKQLPKNQGFDWLGAVLRRKGVVAFSVVIAVVLGYLFYIRQPKEYSSQLTLMIWAQKPPKLTDSETSYEPIMTGKYLQLLSSQKVLEKAVKSGDLTNLQTFKGVGGPVYVLKNMIEVEPIEDVPDTLIVTITGREPSELPEILTQVVSSFNDVLMEDSVAFSKEYTDVFNLFQEKLASDKTDTEERYRSLIQKLGISPDPATRRYINPYLKGLEELKTSRRGFDHELRQANERLGNLREAQELASRGSPDALRVVGIEASKHLQFDFNSGADSNISKTQSRISTLEDRLAELRLEETKMRRSVGDKHPSHTAVTEKLRFYQQELLSQRELMRRFEADRINHSSVADNIKNGVQTIGKRESDLLEFYAVTLERNINRLNSAIELLDKEIGEQDEKVASIRGDVEELNVLSERIRETDADMRQTLDKLSSLAVLASNYSSTKVSVIDRPGIGYQVAPRLLVVMGLFIFVGIAVGVGGVALLDWADLSYRNPTEIKERLGLPVVAKIAKLKNSGKFVEGHSETLVTIDSPKSAMAEAYRACRTALLFLAKQQNMKCFLITSAAAGDGKSTTSLNLAISFAQGGLKTIIVDADLRRPRCHAYLGLTASPGLKDYSVGDATDSQIIRETQVHPNLSIVTAGRNFANPSQFIDSLQFEEFLVRLKEQFDIIIVDSPPVLPVADSLSLSSKCDGVLLVMKIRKGVVLSSQKACESLKSVSANLLGVIVNQVERGSHYSDYGTYGYQGYGGYAYYAGRYYGNQNDKYYENTESETSS